MSGPRGHEDRRSFVEEAQDLATGPQMPHWDPPALRDARPDQRRDERASLTPTGTSGA